MRHEKFFLSLSAPRIFETRRAREDEGLVTTAADRVHVYFSGGYNFRLSNALEFQPSLMLKYVKGAPVSTQFTALLNIERKFDIGVGYRTDNAVSGLAIVKVIDWLNIGYAYESSLRSELQNVENGTHEILLNFIL